MSDERIAKAIELYGAGLSLVNVGKAIGADAETVRQRLLGSGVKLRGPHDRRVPDKREGQ